MPEVIQNILYKLMHLKSTESLGGSNYHAQFTDKASSKILCLKRTTNFKLTNKLHFISSSI